MKLPVLKPNKAISKFKKCGFYIDHQTGSHVTLLHNDGRRITIPKHNRDLKKGTLKNILRQARLSVKKFIELKIF